MMIEPQMMPNPEFDQTPPNKPTTRQILPHDRWNFIDHNTIDLPSHWSVPWADLMMVMMVMFAVMYAAKLPQHDAQTILKKNAPISTVLPRRPEQPKVEYTPDAPISAQEIFKLSQKLVKEANLANIDVVLTDQNAIKVSVHGNLLFDLGMAELKPEAVSFLDQLAKIIATNNYNIEVTGHTDDFPISNPVYPTNWELSTARASRVARYLIQQGNLDPGRFTVLGHASYQPSEPNTTLENKAKNRRVEIVITRQEYKS